MKQNKRRKVAHDVVDLPLASPVRRRSLWVRQLLRPRKPSTHVMHTRTKARVFRFLDLPGELKNRVYRFAFAGDPVELLQLRLPRSLAVPQILSEARAFVFENTPVTVVTRTNWCVRNEYFHSNNPYDMRLEGHGHVEWPAVVKSQSPELVRFRDVMIEGLCCCCRVGFKLMRMRVEVKARSEEEAAGKLDMKIPFTEVAESWIIYPLSGEGLIRMLVAADELTKEIATRQDFNGLTIQDVEGLAMCFVDPL